MIRALVGYLASDALRGQRWMAPVLCFLAGIAMVDAGGGPVLSCYGGTAALILPISLWLTMVVLNSEDEVQAAVTVVTAGASARVRLAKLLAAGALVLPLIALALLWPLVGGHGGISWATLGVGVAAHLSTALTGTAFGALLSRPVLRRTAWAVLGAVAVCLVELIVPEAPPVWQLLNLLTDDAPPGLAGPLALIAAQSVLLAGVLFAVGHRLARARA